MISKTIIESKIDSYHSKPWTYGRAAPSKGRVEDRFMALGMVCKTETSLSLGRKVQAFVLSESERKNITNKTLQAANAVIADLLKAAAISPELYSYRPFGKAEFEGQRIGYRAAKDTVDALVALGMIEKQGGFIDFHRRENAQATTLRATPALLELALSFGITPANCMTHYQYAPRPSRVPHPIIVRGKREYWHDDTKGPKLRLNKGDPAYIAAAEQVQALNGYMARQRIGGCAFAGYQRIFNDGDQPGFAFNMGGRLYAIGGSFQRMPSDERPSITINGEATIELDIRASHLTVIYAVAGIPLDPALDPYTMAWPPRAVAKAWTTMVLGYGKFQNCWSDQTRKTLAKKKGLNVDDYPIDAVRDAMLERHPILKGWPTSELRWPELQFRESQVIIGAISTLAFTYDVPALPIHDSLIVPASKLDLARRVLKECFERQFYATPVCTIEIDGNKVVL